MNQTIETQPESEPLIEDVQALLAATAQAGEEKVIAARQRLAAAIAKAKKTWGTVQDQAIAGAKATDVVIRRHPYQTAGVALGLGALIGYLLARRSK